MLWFIKTSKINLEADVEYSFHCLCLKERLKPVQGSRKKSEIKEEEDDRAVAVKLEDWLMTVLYMLGSPATRSNIIESVDSTK